MLTAVSWEVFVFVCKVGLLHPNVYHSISGFHGIITTYKICWKTKGVLTMKIWIYWPESNSWIHFYIHFVVLNKNWKIYRFEQSFTGLGPENRSSSWGLWKWQTVRHCFYIFNMYNSNNPILIFKLDQ